MNRSTNPFGVLASKAQRGDENAKHQLHRQLEPQLVSIVRRVMQQGVGHTVLDRRILREADRVGWRTDLGSAEERDRLIRLIARSVCGVVIANLYRAPERGAEDTVCGIA
jgi:hypothetical protein